MLSPNDSVFFMPTPVDGGSKDVMSPREQMAALKPYTKRDGKRPRLLQCKRETVDVGGVSMELITYKPHRHQPDDLMYGRNPELRTILPRGCSFYCSSIVRKDRSNRHSCVWNAQVWWVQAHR